MLHGEATGLLLGAVALGAVHGVEPGHGWPVAAAYALDQPNKWVYGLAASLLIGVGHLVSSLAMVAAFFYAKEYFDLARVNEPVHLAGDVSIGGPVSLVAGVLLVALGVREYRHGHAHGAPGRDSGGGHSDGHGSGDSPSHGHDHGEVHSHGHGHREEHDHNEEHSPAHAHGRGRGRELLERLRRLVPFVDGHSHPDADPDDAADRGLLGIAWFAFVLGFAHEEEFEIIALCAGSEYCLELMGAYALTVVVGIVGLTMLLIAGYHTYEERVERFTPYLPALSAAVLVVMGIGFLLGVF